MRYTVLMGSAGLALALVIGLIVLWQTRSEAAEVEAVAATAELVSPSGATIGSVRFTQGESSVLIEAEASGLEPGGHAFVVHSVGACEPDFSAAGDHFDAQDQGRGFVHSNWNRRDAALAGHSGDLPNIYVAADGTVRVDFFTAGVTLESGRAHSLFDSDGSAIVIHEKPIVYESEEEDTGERIACGVIRQG